MGLPSPFRPWVQTDRAMPRCGRVAVQCGRMAVLGGRCSTCSRAHTISDNARAKSAPRLKHPQHARACTHTHIYTHMHTHTHTHTCARAPRAGQLVCAERAAEGPVRRRHGREQRSHRHAAGRGSAGPHVTRPGAWGHARLLFVAVLLHSC